MATIDELITREFNPFDLVNLKPGNFWGEQPDSTPIVESIHQEAARDIEEILNLVFVDHRSRSILLLGDSGSGKSYLLGRLKRNLNHKAFFVYIGPWADSEYIWRHTLRYTVDSLMQVPEGQEESQLVLWLKNLSAFTQRNLKQRIFDDGIWRILQSDRQKFIKHLKESYKQAGIYNSDLFFGVLHDLTEPELYPLACEWLRGDDLSEESLQALKVKHCIDSEDAAKNILANFGRISAATKPIVLCFDNLDNIPKLPDGTQDFQSLFNVNTIIHNDNFKNFCVILSIITNTWRRNVNLIEQADRARVDKQVRLKVINLDQAEAIWAHRLTPLHRQANPQPNSPLFPLSRQLLEQNFVGGKTLPRNALILGRLEYQKYKLALPNIVESKPIEPQTINPPVIQPPEPELVEPQPIIIIPREPVSPEPSIENQIQAEFQLLWQKEYKKSQARYTKITKIAEDELIKMLQEVLSALQAKGIKPKLISGNHASYSLSYQDPRQGKSIGIVWTETSNMNSFFSIMKACQTAVKKNLCQVLYLIRAEGVGKPNLKGNQIYREIFTGTSHRHIKPKLSSVCQLATYHSLVNSALARELILMGKTVSLQFLEELIRESKVLQDCTLLQDIGILDKAEDKTHSEADLRPVKDYLWNIVITQIFMGRPKLIENTHEQFPDTDISVIEQLLNQLCQEGKIQVVNPQAKLEDQTVCLSVNK